MIGGAQQEEGCVKGIHGVMPYHRGQNPEAQHDQANNNAAKTHFQAADKERLVGIIRVQKSPDEGRQHNGQRPRLQEFPQKGNGEGAELYLFRNGGEESDEQNHYPGETRIEQIRKGDIRGRPRAQFIGGQIEHRLVSKEEKGDGDSYYVGNEERARSQSVPTEVAADRYKTRVGFPIEGFRAGYQQEDKRAKSQGRKEVIHQVAAHETGIGIGSVVIEFGLRKHVQLAAKIEQRRHRSETERKINRHIAPAQPLDQEGKSGNAQ